MLFSLLPTLLLVGLLLGYEGLVIVLAHFHFQLFEVVVVEAVAEGLLKVLLLWQREQRIQEENESLLRQLVADTRQVPLERIGVEEVCDGFYIQ